MIPILAALLLSVVPCEQAASVWQFERLPTPEPIVTPPPTAYARAHGRLGDGELLLLLLPADFPCPPCDRQRRQWAETEWPPGVSAVVLDDGPDRASWMVLVRRKLGRSLAYPITVAYWIDADGANQWDVSAGFVNETRRDEIIARVRVSQRRRKTITRSTTTIRSTAAIVPAAIVGRGSLGSQGSHWDWPGFPSLDALASHLRATHGIEPSGMSNAALLAAHDASHQGGGSTGGERRGLFGRRR